MILVWVGVGLLMLALAIVTLPLVLPIPPMRDCELPEHLADPDSLFAQVNDLKIHYKDSGGSKPVLVLLHGFGASLFSFSGIIPELTKDFRVVSFDRIGFGLSQRPKLGEWMGKIPTQTDLKSVFFWITGSFGNSKSVVAGHCCRGVHCRTGGFEQPERVSGLCA